MTDYELMVLLKSFALPILHEGAEIVSKSLDNLIKNNGNIIAEVAKESALLEKQYEKEMQEVEEAFEKERIAEIRCKDIAGDIKDILKSANVDAHKADKYNLYLEDPVAYSNYKGFKSVYERYNRNMEALDKLRDEETKAKNELQKIKRENAKFRKSGGARDDKKHWLNSSLIPKIERMKENIEVLEGITVKGMEKYKANLMRYFKNPKLGDILSGKFKAQINDLLGKENIKTEFSEDEMYELLEFTDREFNASTFREFDPIATLTKASIAVNGHSEKVYDIESISYEEVIKLFIKYASSIFHTCFSSAFRKFKLKRSMKVNYDSMGQNETTKESFLDSYDSDEASGLNVSRRHRGNPFNEGTYSDANDMIAYINSNLDAMSVSVQASCKKHLPASHYLSKSSNAKEKIKMILKRIIGTISSELKNHRPFDGKMKSAVQTAMGITASDPNFDTIYKIISSAITYYVYDFIIKLFTERMKELDKSNSADTWRLLEVYESKKREALNGLNDLSKVKASKQIRKRAIRIMAKLDPEFAEFVKKESAKHIDEKTDFLLESKPVIEPSRRHN